MIIAGRSSQPWAYMILIEEIFTQVEKLYQKTPSIFLGNALSTPPKDGVNDSVTKLSKPAGRLMEISPLESKTNTGEPVETQQRQKNRPGGLKHLHSNVSVEIKSIQPP